MTHSGPSRPGGGNTSKTTKHGRITWQDLRLTSSPRPLHACPYLALHANLYGRHTLSPAQLKIVSGVDDTVPWPTFDGQIVQIGVVVDQDRADRLSPRVAGPGAAGTQDLVAELELADRNRDAGGGGQDVRPPQARRGESKLADRMLVGNFRREILAASQP
jgi:hypothetical protein